MLCTRTVCISLILVFSLLVIFSASVRRTDVTGETIGCTYVPGEPKTSWLFLRVDNIATVSGRKASVMLKVSRFCLENSVKLGCQ